MTVKDDIRNAIAEAAREAAAFMTTDLRDRQTSDGWHPDVVNATMVSFDENGKFTAEVAPDQADQGFVHEYGNGDVLPTATIRKYGTTNNAAAQEALLVTLADKVGGYL